MKFLHLLRVIPFALFVLPAAAQTLLQTYRGVAGDEYGHAVLQTADQNSDGYVDVLVGAPGWNSGRGYIRCLSGKFIATGVGSPILWTLYSTANAGARFGSSIIEVGTLTGNSATDYVIGAPGVTTSTVSTGALVLVDGSTHTVAWTMTGDFHTRLGESTAAVGDQDGDGKVDVASNAPSTNNQPSSVHVIRGSSFGVAATLASSQHSSFNVSPYTDTFGVAMASGFDLDHDGRFDLAIGSPGLVAGDGYVMVCRADPSFTFLGGIFGTYAGEGLGAAIDGTRDFDADGTNDLVVGAPSYDSGLGWETGRAVVVSGARLLNATTPLELYPVYFNSTLTSRFGACVRSSADLNNDGTADFIVGMPAYWTPFGIGRGGAVVYSGRTGMELGRLNGATNDVLGDGLIGGFLDLDANGFLEFAVAGSLSDNPTTDNGALKFYSLFPTAWGNYCVGKVNSLGCTPALSGSGTASASSSAPFLITCSSVINKKSGLMIYSHGPNAGAFQGGTLCVKPPITRTTAQNSGGSPSGSDCTGTFSYDMNARIQSGLDPSLVVGAEIFCQCWSRDPASTAGASLSNALRCLVNP